MYTQNVLHTLPLGSRVQVSFLLKLKEIETEILYTEIRMPLLR